MPTEPPRHQFETQLTALVEKFARHHDEYLRADYSEAEVRAEFIDPFFEALGWDVQNRAGRSPKEREVMRERGETAGRPDYAFQIGGRARFYVEAKAPHVPLERVDVVMQAKSYAWHSRDVFLAAVTDFEEFRLYDGRAKPDRKHPNAGLIFAYCYDEYLTPKALDDLWLLSRDAVAAGSIDQLLKKSSVQARQRIPVDQAFLDDLSAWREQLAKAVFKAYPDLSPADLNSVVQVFLDRLIFVRICEDRRIVAPRQLAEIAENWEYSGKRVSITNDLNALFHAVNVRLNGEIFEPHRCEKIDWDINAALVADIIKHLYFPASPYLFDKIPVELLGSIYERYLGKTIRVTATRAVVEDKPAVRKAGGVYYTPKYIVDYIVAQTVGKLLEGKTPKQIEKLRILDPACGSGSFLIGAYQALLDHHTRYFSERAAQRAGGGASGQPRLLREEGAEYGEFKLSLEQKAAILRNNIFGVDIDPQAVEITMMSLYIKMLEDERGFLSGNAVLPRLRDNIKCGNSLIGYDIGDLSEADRERINPFDWRSRGEGFGAIMAEGGFDAVIGNPPYVRGRSLEPSVKEYLLRTFLAFTANADLYIAFLERGFALLREGGMMSFIVPRSYIGESYAEKSRRHFLGTGRIVEIVDLQGVKVFQDATVTNAILVLQKDAPSKTIPVRHWNQSSPTVLDTRSILDATGALIRPELSDARQAVIAKVKQTTVPLSDLCYVSYSVAAHSEVENKKKDAYIFDRKKNSKCKRFIEAREIARYEIVYAGRWLEYDPRIVRRPGLPELFDAPKIMVRDVVGQMGLICALDDTGLYADYSVVCLTLKSNLQQVTSRRIVWTSQAIELARRYSLHYILGILNSSLLNFVFKTTIGGGLHVYPGNLRQLPIRVINFSDPTDRARHDQLVARVERMLELHKQKQATTSETTRARIEREIHVTDEQIDALVYELYGLTPEEIAIVEKSA